MNVFSLFHFYFIHRLAFSLQFDNVVLELTSENCQDIYTNENGGGKMSTSFVSESLHFLQPTSLCRSPHRPKLEDV